MRLDCIRCQPVVLWVLVAGCVLSSLPLEARTSGVYSIGRIVRFRYRQGRSETILTRPDAVTDLILPAGEHPVSLALGDTVRWVVAQDTHDIFIKPVRAGLFTSGTLVTNRRRYELIFVSVPPGSPWYQAVSWRTQSLWSLRDAPPPPSAIRPVRSRRPACPTGQPWYRRLHFAYRIHGKAPWRPVRVFDDGRRTFIELARGVQDMPALFVRHGHRYSLVNYRVHGRWILYPHRFRAAELQLGRRRVRMDRRLRRGP
jgi:type IV secretion system protein VirB9